MSAVAAGDRIVNPVQQDAATFLETSAQSGGARTLLLLEVAPGGRVEPHEHVGYSEAFRVLEGRMTVVDGDVTHLLESGEAATIAPGVRHAWSNPGTQTAVAEVELRPGQPGFELTLRVGYGLARDGRTTAKGLPKNPLALALLLDWADVRLGGPARHAQPLFAVLAWVARRGGLDARLRRAYAPGR